MFVNFSRLSVGLGLLDSLLLLQCGGRSDMLLPGEGGLPPMACAQDSDCLDGNLCVTKACLEGYCSTVESKTCNDGDECTADACNGVTGQCVFTQRAQDNDGDGFYGPLPGTVAGTIGSCGNDCNDATATAYPGAPEQCDGYDNNCDGRVDEGAYGYYISREAVRATNDSFLDGGPTGLIYNGSYFGLTFTGSTTSTPYQGYFTGFNPWASTSVPLTNITQTAKDSFAGPLLWTGSVFATAWEVRGQKGYDIRFNQLDVLGQKMGPDLLVSNGSGFSIQPSLIWNGAQYWIVWSDDNGGDLFQIYGRKVAMDGQLIGEQVSLTDLNSDARTPLLLRSPTSYLLLFLSARSQAICGRILGKDMTPVGDTFCLSSSHASGYSADWVGDRFIVAWSTERAQPGDSIWASSIDSRGNLLQSAQTLTSGANFARNPSLLSLGDRFALAWADDRVSYGHYGIRFSTFSPELAPMSGVQIAAERADDCIDPTIASGGVGLALVYRERTNGQTGFPYITAMTCEYRSSY